MSKVSGAFTLPKVTSGPQKLQENYKNKTVNSNVKI